MSDEKFNEFDYAELGQETEQAEESVQPEEEVEQAPIEPTQTAQPKPSEDKEGSVKDVDHKPWVAKKRGKPPSVGVQNRFRELTQSIKAERLEKDKLLAENERLRNPVVDKKVERTDFPDDESYNEARDEARIEKLVSERIAKAETDRVSKEANDQVVKESQKLQGDHIEAARSDLESSYEGAPTYEAAMQNAVQINLASDLIAGLERSPAAPYVKYNIATDDELAARIQQASPDEQYKIIAELNNTMLDYISKKGAPPAQAIPTQEAPGKPAGIPSPATRTRRLPTSPPKVSVSKPGGKRPGFRPGKDNDSFYKGLNGNKH